MWGKRMKALHPLISVSVSVQIQRAWGQLREGLPLPGLATKRVSMLYFEAIVLIHTPPPLINDFVYVYVLFLSGK
jgi:hypothetical protein